MTLVRRTTALAAALAAALLVVAGQPAAGATTPTPVPAQGAAVAATAPAPVTGLTATSLASAIRLTWTLPSASGLAGVVVRRLAGSVPPASPTEGALVASGLVTTTTDTGLDWATTYAYAVFSVGTSGDSSAPVTVLGIPADLPNASALNASGTSTSSLSLTWVLPQDDRVAGLRIERLGCTAPNAIELVVDVPAPGTRYDDSGLTRGAKYCYRARTYDTTGRTHRGTTVGANTTVWWAPPVTNLTAVSGGDSVSLSWRMPDDPTVTGVQVLRSDGVVVLDGVGTAAVDRNGVLPGHSYTYTVLARTADAHSAPAATVKVTTTLGWTSQELDPDVGWPNTLSCATATWCLSTDQSGNYRVLTGTTWSAPTPLPAASGAGPGTVWRLSCPTAGWCLAHGPDGFQRYAGGHWSGAAGTPQPSAAPWLTLTCTSSTWCIAMADDGHYAVLSGNVWSSGVPRGLHASWNDVACQVAGRCFALGTDTAGRTWRATLLNQVWTTARIYSPWYTPTGIECPASSWCLATSANGYSVIKGTTWGTWGYYPAGAGVGANLTCASTTSCWGGTSDSRGSRWNGTTWSRAAAVTVRYNDTIGIQCPRTSTTCHAIDDRGRHYAWTSASGWRLQSTFDPTSGGLRSTACVSDVRCFSFDRNGWLLALDGTTWARTTKLFYNEATADCLPSGFCLALEDRWHQYRTYANGVWSAARAAPPGTYLGTPACGSPTMCLVGDSQGAVWRFNGTSWVAAGTPFKAVAAGAAPTIHCTSATWCMAVGNDGAWSRYNGTTWTALGRLPGLTGAGTPLMSCASATMCLAVVDSAATALWNGTTWAASYSPAFGYGYRLSAIDCVTANHCVGVHGYSNDSAPVIWSQGWLASAPYDRQIGPQDIDCPTATTCFITTSTGISRSRAA